MNKLDRLLALAEQRDTNPSDDLATMQLIGAVDALVASIDERVSAVLDAVLHAPAFQSLEAAWCGLHHLVSGIRPDDRTRVALWNVTKAELEEDLVGDIRHTQLFAVAYTSEYGQFGGHPYGAAFLNYDVTHTDLPLLRGLAAVGVMAHVAMFLSPHPRLVGVDRWEDLRDAADVHESPAYVEWTRFRSEEDSRAIGLVLPRELARLPYDTADGPLGYVETIRASGHGLVWASPIYSLALRFAHIFGRTGQLGTILGDDADSPPPIVVPTSPATGTAKTSLEATITPRVEHQLRPLGLIAIQQVGGRLVLGSAHSLAKPKDVPLAGRSKGDRNAGISHLLGTRFPYLLLGARFAHYMKVLQRERLGEQAHAGDIQRELEEWLSLYTVNQDGAPPEIRASHPLREAHVTVNESAETFGHVKSVILLRPHLRYLGAEVTLDVRLRHVPRGDGPKGTKSLPTRTE